MKGFFTEDAEIREIARLVIEVRPEVAHVEIERVLFLRHVGGKCKDHARCYSFADHPIRYFTDNRFCLVIYEDNTFYFTAAQMALLILHELMHIPERGDKLVDHDRKDFARVLGIGGIFWASPGEDVPDILGGIL